MKFAFSLLFAFSIMQASPINTQCRMIFFFSGPNPQTQSQTCSFTDSVTLPGAAGVDAFYSNVTDLDRNTGAFFSMTSAVVANGEEVALRPVRSRPCDGCSDTLYAFSVSGPQLSYEFSHTVQVQYIGGFSSAYLFHSNIWNFVGYEASAPNADVVENPEPATILLVLSAMAASRILTRRGKSWWPRRP